MSGETPARSRQGLLDTNILVLRRWIDPAELPDEMAISAVTLAELSAGSHQVRPNTEQDLYDEHEERSRRTEALQRAESEFDPVPFDAEAARIYGRVTDAVIAAGRKPRRRIADLQQVPLSWQYILNASLLVRRFRWTHRGLRGGRSQLSSARCP
jgi:predicted nucleic acid-binding protein